MNSRYGTLASWGYDLDKPVGRTFGDIAYYRRRLEDCAGPILEPAVGSSTHVCVPQVLCETAARSLTPVTRQTPSGCNSSS